MITQAIMDFFRDVVVNWITGINPLTAGMNLSEAGAAIGGVASQAGRFLALFVSPSVWGALLAAWSAWLVVWLATGLIAIISRRTKSE